MRRHITETHSVKYTQRYLNNENITPPVSSAMDNPTSSTSWSGGTTTSTTTTPAFIAARSSRINGNHRDTDSNNNSISCANHERMLVEERQKAAANLDISELAKTIGNEFRGEFIVLQQHLVTFDNGEAVDLERPAQADDEVSSNSEDCVYAYRGDHEIHQIAIDGEHQLVGGGGGGGGLHDDDNGEEDEETDYLEMDFDPEPNSEQEPNYRRSIGEGELANEDFLRIDPRSLMMTDRQTKASNELISTNEPVAGCSTNGGTAAHDKLTGQLSRGGSKDIQATDTSVQDLEEESSNLDDYYDHEFNDLSSDDEGDAVVSLDVVTAIEVEEVDNPRIVKLTGTKPKVKLSDSTAASVPHSFPTIPHVPIPSNTNDTTSCLECSEMELLSAGSQSTGSVCKKHCKKLRNNEPDHEPTATDTSVIEASGDCNQIQICPNILNEENIYNSFLVLGIELHRERLRELIKSNILSLDQTKSIAGYLIRFTKANCDPRRFVKLIEKCCPKEIFSQLEFNFQSVSAEFNVLHVAASEILSRWSSEEGLRELSRVGNKRFHTANVLGRVANLLRLRISSNGRTREINKETPSTLLVPTYHRPGIFQISRRTNQTNATLL